MTGPCHVCGTPQIARYERGDGVMVGTCCLLIAVKVAERHELARRIHDAAHGHPGEGCPVCATNAAHELLWGEPGHVYDGGMGI